MTERGPRGHTVIHEGDTRQLAFETSTRVSAQWAAASGDFDPIHYDGEYALRQKLPGTIVNGRLKIALLARVVASFAGPGGRVRRLAARHQAMDAIGEPLSVGATVTRVLDGGAERHVELELWVENPRQQRTAAGSASIILPASVQWT